LKAAVPASQFDGQPAPAPRAAKKKTALGSALSASRIIIEGPITEPAENEEHVHGQEKPGKPCCNSEPERKDGGGNSTTLIAQTHAPVQL